MTAVENAILLIVAFFNVVGHSEGIEIKVSVQDPSLNRDFKTDAYANIPEIGISGYLVYPKPKLESDGCREFHMLNYSSYSSYIAFIDDYDNCTSQLVLQSSLEYAGYVGMIGVSENIWNFRALAGDFAVALVKDGDFGDYLKHYAGINSTKVTMEEDMSVYQHYFLIFSALLLSAIVLSVIVFCCTMCCRLGVHRWANRRVTLWSVRRLPKRKYCAERETCDTCSICLDPFKENESLRVLPCQHVYHPRCIDEWLHKWNRVCPLCKATISVGRRNHSRQTVVERSTERAHLLINEDATIENGRRYGTANVQSPPLPAAATTAAVVTPNAAREGVGASPQTEGIVNSLADESSCVPLVAEQGEQSSHNTAVKA